MEPRGRAVLTLTDPATGRTRRTPVQLLGTEAKASGTWLWVWANASVAIAVRALELAGRLRAFGKQHAARRPPQILRLRAHRPAGSRRAL